MIFLVVFGVELFWDDLCVVVIVYFVEFCVLRFLFIWKVYFILVLDLYNMSIKGSYF